MLTVVEKLPLIYNTDFSRQNGSGLFSSIFYKKKRGVNSRCELKNTFCIRGSSCKKFPLDGEQGLRRLKEKHLFLHANIFNFC